MLHKGYKYNLISEGVQSIPLCSNEDNFGCTPLVIKTPFNSIDESLNYLAELLTDFYLEKVYENRKTNKIKQSSSLCESID